MRLVLFDIDGTLLSTGRAGADALLRALAETYGTTGPIERWSFGGKTDPQIVWELMTEAGVDPVVVEARFDAVIDRYLAHLEARMDPARIKLKPGVTPLLEALAAHPGVVLGLLTGNVVAGAELKLRSAGLWSYFTLGAYGSDHRHREHLPAIAASRAEELTGRRFAGKEIVIIGDTPNDVLCGRGLGCKAIAVATGSYGRDDLAAHDPDYCFADLSDTPAVVGAILA
ncbi:MAG: HAD family hydrolase [Candidatus Sericytochromatia bacterium]|nr:HAD family hydrolase [Candidatus Tanganyikabacteria bacterium]